MKLIKFPNKHITAILLTILTIMILNFILALLIDFISTYNPETTYTGLKLVYFIRDIIQLSVGTFILCLIGIKAIKTLQDNEETNQNNWNKLLGNPNNQ